MQSFLQIALNEYPLSIENGALTIVEVRDSNYFTLHLKDAFEKVDQRFSALPIIKGLLAIDEEQRFSTSQALKAMSKIHVRLKSKELFEHLERELDEVALKAEETELVTPRAQSGIIEVIKANKPNAYLLPFAHSITQTDSSKFYGADLPFYSALQEVYQSSPDETRPLLSYDTVDLNAASSQVITYDSFPLHGDKSQEITYDTFPVAEPSRKQGNTSGIWAHQN